MQIKNYLDFSEKQTQDKSLFTDAKFQNATIQHSVNSTNLKSSPDKMNSVRKNKKFKIAIKKQQKPKTAYGERKSNLEFYNNQEKSQGVKFSEQITKTTNGPEKRLFQNLYTIQGSGLVKRDLASSLMSENTSYQQILGFGKLGSEKTFFNENSNVSTVNLQVQVNLQKKEVTETASLNQPESNNKSMQQPQKKAKKDLSYLLGLSDSTSLVGQNIQQKQTQATDSNTKIIEYEYGQKDEEILPEPLDDIWAVKFFKKNLNSQEKFQKRLRSANPQKRDKNKILPRQEFINQTDEEKLQEMFLKTQDQFDLDSALKLLSGLAAENYLKLNEQISDENQKNKLIKSLNDSAKNTSE